jgi:hypothetical protein
MIFRALSHLVCRKSFFSEASLIFGLFWISVDWLVFSDSNTCFHGARIPACMPKSKRFFNHSFLGFHQHHSNPR